MINNETTIERFLELECSEHIETLWGQECKVKPELITEKLGDGLQVLYWGTIDQRPQYWVLCIDSKTDIEADNFNQQDELYNMVTDQFGSYDPSDDEDYDDFEYPIVKDTCGFFWGILKNFGKNE